MLPVTATRCDGSLILSGNGRPVSVRELYSPGPSFPLILLIVLIRKLPGPLSHPLVDWPGFFVPVLAQARAGRRSNSQPRVKTSGDRPIIRFSR